MAFERLLTETFRGDHSGQGCRFDGHINVLRPIMAMVLLYPLCPVNFKPAAICIYVNLGKQSTELNSIELALIPLTLSMKNGEIKQN